MKREILFRGKRVDNNEWVYGYLRSYDEINNYYVDKKTVGQFTGLMDKNGNRIFEGDIVERAYEYEVRYESGRFYLHHDKGFHVKITAMQIKTYEITGNIHESLTPNK